MQDSASTCRVNEKSLAMVEAAITDPWRDLIGCTSASAMRSATRGVAVGLEILIASAYSMMYALEMARRCALSPALGRNLLSVLASCIMAILLSSML